MPRVCSPVVSTATCENDLVNSSGWVSAQHRKRVVHGGATQVLVATDVGAAEEAHQIGECRRQLTRRSANLIDAFGRGLQLMRDVEAGHDQRASVADDDCGGFGIRPDVELGGGCAVAEQAAAHERDARRPCAAMSGADRSARAMLVIGPVGTSHTPSLLRTVSMMKATASPTGRRPGRRRKLCAVESALTVHVSGVTRLGNERSARARMHRYVDAEQIANHDGVVRRRFQRCVARDGGDAEQVGMASRDDHRDGVVMPRVAVEDDGQTPTFGMMLVGWCHDHQSMPPLPSGREVETMVGACGSSR